MATTAIKQQGVGLWFDRKPEYTGPPTKEQMDANKAKADAKKAAKLKAANKAADAKQDKATRLAFEQRAKFSSPAILSGLTALADAKSVETYEEEFPTAFVVEGMDCPTVCFDSEAEAREYIACFDPENDCIDGAQDEVMLRLVKLEFNTTGGGESPDNLMGGEAAMEWLCLEDDRELSDEEVTCRAYDHFLLNYKIDGEWVSDGEGWEEFKTQWGIHRHPEYTPEVQAEAEAEIREDMVKWTAWEDEIDRFSIKSASVIDELEMGDIIWDVKAEFMACGGDVTKSYVNGFYGEYLGNTVRVKDHAPNMSNISEIDYFIEIVYDSFEMSNKMKNLESRLGGGLNSTHKWEKAEAVEKMRDFMANLKPTAEYLACLAEEAEYA